MSINEIVFGIVMPILLFSSLIIGFYMIERTKNLIKKL